MSKPQIVTGDDSDLTITLQDADGAAVNVAGATIKVAITDPGRTKILAGPYTCSSSYAGSAWGSGIVVVALVGSETGTITVPFVGIETQVVSAGKYTSYFNVQPVEALRGLIP